MTYRGCPIAQAVSRWVQKKRAVIEGAASALSEGAAPRALTDSKDKVPELKLWARPPRFQREPTTRIRCWERTRARSQHLMSNFEPTIFILLLN